MSGIEQGAESFWRFSLALYGVKPVAEACLRLQDRDGLDVNLLLYLCWAGSRGTRFDSGQVGALIAETEGWRREVVRPLRRARRALKGFAAPGLAEAAAELRGRIKRDELESERLQQRLMVSWHCPAEGAADPAASAHNLAAYLEAARAGATESQRDLAALLRGAVPGLTEADALTLLES
ncbi:MAG: TIGR02444 family protein [Kiloniellales bacterium]